MKLVRTIQSRPLLLDFYRVMFRIRRFEQQAEELFRQAEGYGSLHLSTGQEATAAGACAALRNDDYMTCTYRGHGVALAKGTPVEIAMAELLGRSTGCCGGRGGSMFFTDLRVGNLGGSGVVAGGIPMAVGAALSAKRSGTERVAITFFGDGATNQGVFHEALNMAALWKLPCIFFCENNQYAEMTPIHKEASFEHLADRSGSYGIPGVVVDGNDVEAVYDTTRDAVERARVGEGPTLIEAITYRLAGHMFGDPETYRSREEVDSWRAKEPLQIARQRLSEQGVSPAAVAQVESAIEAEIAAAVAFARQSPEPEESEASAYVIS